MNSGVESLINLVNKFDAERTVAFRMALLPENDEWNLHTLVIENIPAGQENQIPNFTYNYGDVVFIAGATSGRKVMDFLKGSRIYNYTFHSSLSQRINDNNVGGITGIRYPSHAERTNFGVIPYPVTEYYISPTTSRMQVPDGFLVGQNCPFFSSFQEALASLIYKVNNPQQIRNYQEAFFIRVLHDDARIEKVDLSPTLLTVHLIDAEMKSSLQISSPPNVLYDDIASQDTITIPLPDGVPSNLWVVLKRGSEWLDYVHLGQQFPFLRTQQNVNVVPADIRTRVQELIAQGEGPTTEFKQEIPEKTDKMLKTVAAFANGDGGVILLGVEDDTGKVIGIPRDKVNSEKDRLTNMVRNVVYPEPVVRLEHVDMDEKHEQGQVVIAIYVDRGTSLPYCLRANDPKYYVRRGATTFIARQEEVRTMVQLDTQLSNIQNQRNGL